MKKVKVAHILHSVGGVEVYLRLVTENANPDFIENIIIHQKDNNKKVYFNKNNVKIKEFEIPIQREISIIKDLHSIFKTIKILKEERPDIIHAHSAKGGIVARAASLFYKVKVLHTPHAYSFLSSDSKYKRHLFLIIEKIFKNFNSILLATSQSELNQGIEKVGYKKKRALLFNNSIKPINEIKNLTIPKVWPDKYICSVGRPSYQKNIELMLDVLFEVKKNIKNIHLVIMGVGFHAPNLETVKEKIKNLNLDKNVTLLEWTSRDDIFNIIHGSLLYLSTSRYEGLPYSIIESLALSKPIVATNCDGNRDLVKHNYNGFLINDEDKNELSNSIVKILNNECIRSKFSKNSLNLFLENFDLTKNIKILENLYIENLNR